jgi:hypothetical protein
LSSGLGPTFGTLGATGTVGIAPLSGAGSGAAGGMVLALVGTGATDSIWLDEVSIPADE